MRADEARDGAPRYGPALADQVRVQGAETLSDHELLEVVLGEHASRELLNLAGGVTGLRRLGERDLVSIPGVGAARAARLRAALELGRRALLPEPLSGMIVRGSDDIARAVQVEIGAGEQEAMHVFGMDARHRVRLRKLVALGQVDRVQVSIADVLRPLVREGLAAFIMAHNHPSGEPDPSPQDELLTVRMAQAAQLMGLAFLDHIVVGRNGYYSFAEKGRLAQLLGR